MTYQSQDQLAQDPVWQARVRACAVQQAEQTYVAAADLADAAFAQAVLRYEGTPLLALFQVCASSPTLADRFEAAGDTSTIGDQDVLSAVQAYWHDTASSFYDEQGQPRDVRPPLLVP